MSKHNFEVTIAFKEENKPKFQKALDFAKEKSNYQEVKRENFVKHIAVFDKSSIKNLFEFYDLASEFILYILINGRARPFTRELWLPLLWLC